MRKKPEERPSSAEELADRLASCEVGAWTKEDTKRWWALGSVGRDGEHPEAPGAVDCEGATQPVT